MQNTLKNSLAIYDLGIGGLSIIPELRKFLPQIAIHYFCDSEFFVYDSTAGFSQLQDRCRKATKSMFEMKSNLVVLATHTMTLTSLDELIHRWIPTEYDSMGKAVIGVRLSLGQDLFERHWHLRDEIGLFLMSHASIRTGYYQQECLKKGFNNAIFVPADKLNTAIEFGDSLAIDMALKEILSPFVSLLDKVKYIVPGSTHFELIGDRIHKLFDDEVVMVMSAPEIAHNIVKYINKHPEFKVDSGITKYYTNGPVQAFKDQIKKYTGEDVDPEQFVVKAG